MWVCSSWKVWKVGYRGLLFNLAMEAERTKIDIQLTQGSVRIVPPRPQAANPPGWALPPPCSCQVRPQKQPPSGLVCPDFLVSPERFTHSREKEKKNEEWLCPDVLHNL